MAEPEFVVALAPVVDALAKLGVRYYVAGSVASSYFGIARSTADVDVVAELAPEHAAPLEEALRDVAYVDLDAVRDAIRRRSMFNVVHLETMLKVDVYVVATAFDRASLDRAAAATMSDDPGARAMSMATAEDVVVHKLVWYAKSAQSERQWNDVLGVLRVQAGRLDVEHMRTWASRVGVGDLLERALSEATTPRP